MATSFRDKKGVQFVYNPELSGDVMIRLPKPDSENHDILRVPMESVVEFMGEVIRQRKMKSLEAMPALQLLTDS